MKKLNFYVIIAIICVSKLANAQDFEGVVTMKMLTKGITGDVECIVKKDQSLMLTKAGEITVQKRYSDGKSSYVLLDQNGQKRAMKAPSKIEDKKEEPKVEITQETKQILGHTCTKIIITAEKGSSIAWVTKEVQIDFAKVMGSGASEKGVSGKMKEYGFPLEFEVPGKQGELIQFTVTKIEPKSITNTAFPNLSEYTIQEMPIIGGK